MRPQIPLSLLPLLLLLLLLVVVVVVEVVVGWQTPVCDA